MPSPIGGFYLNALNRQKKAKFELSQRSKINLTLCYQQAKQTIIEQNQELYITEPHDFSDNNYRIAVTTKLLSSGLLHVECSLYLADASNCFAIQVFNLSPNESISSAIEGSYNDKLSLLAKPCNNN